MQAFMNTINEGITATTIWEQITPVASLVVVVTLVGLGAYVINKNLKAVKKHSSGRV